MEHDGNNETVLMYEEDLRFTKSDFDQNGKIKASSLMHVFEDVAIKHADQLGVGWADLMKDNLIWVLNKLRFQVHLAMKADVAYQMRTFPRKQKGVTFFRDYYIYDESGNLAAVGTSQWCVINFVTRKIERNGVSFEGNYIERKAFADGIAKLKINDEALTLIGSHSVTEEDLDENEHVNNCRYADMVEKVLEGHTDFTINFVKEARLGDEIRLYQELQDGSILVVGKLADGTVIFQAKVR